MLLCHSNLLIRGTLAYKSFELNVHPALLNPDCFNQSYAAMIINNQFPSPAIRVLKGDTVQIKVTNDITSQFDTSVHFHGIRQIGTNGADGVPDITQVAIKPGDSFTHQFSVYNQTGTYYYHAHVGVQDDTIQGPFIIYENEASLKCLNSDEREQGERITEGPYTYDDEIIFQWTEWWHQNFFDRQKNYMSPNFPGDPGPDSILLNGRAIYQNTTIAGVPENCPGFTYFDVLPNKTYRIRNIAALTFRFFAITIKDHDMTLIEIDGEYIDPLPVEYIELAPGQRMSVLIRTGNYSEGTTFPIATNLRRTNLRPPGYTQSGYGFLRYVSPSSYRDTADIKMIETPFVSDLPNIPEASPPTWLPLNDASPTVSPDEDFLNMEAAQTIKFSMKELITVNNLTRYINNGHPYIERPWGNDTISLLEKVLYDDDSSIGVLAADGFSVNHQTYPVNFMDVVDLVFQNVYIAANVCVPHPWHTHGFSHYLLAEGYGDYQHEIHKDIRTFSTPLYKDVSIVYPLLDPNDPSNENCGWTKVRIIAVK